MKTLTVKVTRERYPTTTIHRVLMCVRARERVDVCALECRVYGHSGISVSPSRQGRDNTIPGPDGDTLRRIHSIEEPGRGPWHKQVYPFLMFKATLVRARRWGFVLYILESLGDSSRNSRVNAHTSQMWALLPVSSFRLRIIHVVMREKFFHPTDKSGFGKCVWCKYRREIRKRALYSIDLTWSRE